MSLIHGEEEKKEMDVTLNFWFFKMKGIYSSVWHFYSNLCGVRDLFIFFPLGENEMVKYCLSEEGSWVCAQSLPDL